MAEETTVFARKASGLVREMSAWDVLLIAIAGPAASGMAYYSVKVPGLVPGGNMVLAFLVGGLLWLFPVVLVAVYASSFPRSASMYVAISRVIHPLVGFLPNWLWIVGGGFAVGFLNYLGLNLISSGLQVGGQLSGNSSMASAGDWIAGEWNRFFIAVALTVVVWAMQLSGMDRLKWFLRVVIYVPLFVTGVAFVLFFAVDGAASWNELYGAGVTDRIIQAANDQGLQEAIESPGSGLYDMLLWVFWAYTAVECVSFVGSEVKSPRTSFMRGITLGFGAVVLLYCVNAWAPGVSFGSDFIRDYSYLYYTSDETYAALEAAMGTTPPIPSIPFYAGVCSGSASLAVSLGVGFFFWYYNSALITWIAAVRGLFAMAFDRQLPLALCAVSKRGTPTNATHAIGVMALIGCLLGYGDSHSPDTAWIMMAILDYMILFFIWTLGLTAVFMPYLRPDLFEKSTFQRRIGPVPAMTVLGFIVLGIGWWTVFMVGLELSELYSQIGLACIITAGFGLVAAMYARNRKEGIDPNQIYAQIPPS